MSRIHFQKRRDFLKGATCMVASGAAGQVERQRRKALYLMHLIAISPEYSTQR